MTNHKLELTITLEGATLANLVLADDSEKLSPLWNPIRLRARLCPYPAVSQHISLADITG